MDRGGGFPSGSEVKNLPTVQEMQEIQIQSLGWENPLEEGMATQSCILTWRIPYSPAYTQRDLAGYTPWGCKELDITEVTEHTCTHRQR